MSAKNRLLLVGALLLLFGQPARSSAQDQGQAPPPLDPARFAGTRVHARALEIAAARQANLELFETVAPYFEPQDNPVARQWSRRLPYSRPVPWTLRPLGLDVLHSDYGDAIARYSEAVPATRDAVRAYNDGARAAKGGQPSAQTLQDQFLAKLGEIREAHDIPWEEYSLIVVASGRLFGDWPHWNPKYRVAWEEALLRDLPWGAKAKFLRIVVSFDDEESIPVIGQVLRDSKEAEINKRNRWLVAKCNNRAWDALTDRVCAECLAELIETVRSTTGSKRDGVRRGIGRVFEKSPEWVAFVNNLETKGEAPEDVAIIRDAIEFNKNYKFPMPTPPAKP